MSLKVGDKAPGFKAIDQNETNHTLSDYKDKWLLLYFYPKDHTSGCTTEACQLRDHYHLLKEKATILGVSKDSVKSHQSFALKHDLPFSLLSDQDRSIITAYGTNGVMLPKRTSFLISPKGLIKKIYKKVNPKIHAQQVLEDLKSFQS